MVDRRRQAATLGAAAGLAAVLAGCSGSPSGSPTPASPPAAPSAGIASREAVPTSRPSTGTTATPSEAPSAPPSVTASLPDAPPGATLHGLAGGQPATGALGSYTWSGSGSDAPWVVGRPVGSARQGSALTTTFAGISPAAWTAAWARVAAGSAGDPIGGVAGTGPVAVAAPGAGGDWSLRVTASFGPGANATYYWRLAVAP